MRVWLITVGEPLPTDGDKVRLLRTGILAGLLDTAGHQVVWWSSSFNHTAKRQRCDRDVALTVTPRLEIKLLHALGYPRNVSLRRVINHRRIARKFAQAAARESRPDVILCSFPTIELSKAAAEYGRARGIPVVLDIRDLWPDAFIKLLPAPVRPFAKLVLWRMFRDTQQALQRSDSLVAVSAGYLEWALRRAHRERCQADRVFHLGYEPVAVTDEEVRQAETKLRGQGVDPSKVICWFVGVFGRTYDLGPVIDAAHDLPPDVAREVQFVFCGEGEYRDEWVARSSGTNCIFPGWIDAAELSFLMRASSIGLAAYAPGAPQGLSNKIFEYLSAGLPILSSLRGETESLLDRHQCGLTYRAGDRQSFRETLQTLVRDGAQRTRMGKNSKRLFEEQFSTDRIYQHMIAFLLEMGQPSKRTSGRLMGANELEDGR